jgi:hypothetical protein
MHTVPVGVAVSRMCSNKQGGFGRSCKCTRSLRRDTYDNLYLRLAAITIVETTTGGASDVGAKERKKERRDS